MNLLTLRLVLFAVLLVLVAAWSKEDYEIFRLNDEVTSAEGANVTFYEFLEVSPNASQDAINKAYKKKSRQIHPDKARRAFITNSSKDKTRSKPPSKREINQAVKIAHERSARLNVVVNILRGPLRDRYDHFLKNGFPKWKGTGYYYSRFRPGLGSVLVGLFLVFGGAAHYGALILSWKRQREFVNRYIRQARRAAWGDDLGVRGIPGLDSTASATGAGAGAGGDGDGEQNAMPVNRRQKRMMDRENRKESKRPRARNANNANGNGNGNGESTPPTTESTGERKRVIAENGKVLIVDGVGNVFLEEESEDGERQEFLLDIDEIQKPTLRDTMIFRLPGWCFHKTVGRVIGGSGGDGTTEEDVAAGAAEDEAEQVVEETAPSKSRRKGKRSQRS